jgi:hypothetical protein
MLQLMIERRAPADARRAVRRGMAGLPLRLAVCRQCRRRAQRFDGVCGGLAAGARGGNGRQRTIATADFGSTAA